MKTSHVGPMFLGFDNRHHCKQFFFYLRLQIDHLVQVFSAPNHQKEL